MLLTHSFFALVTNLLNLQVYIFISCFLMNVPKRPLRVSIIRLEFFLSQETFFRLETNKKKYIADVGETTIRVQKLNKITYFYFKKYNLAWYMQIVMIDC